MARTLITLEELHQFDNLELLARQVVEGFIIGLHQSPYHGFSVEFAEHRAYNPGESVRNIDWKVYGRTDRMFVKKFEEETNLRCQLVLDCSSSMFYPEEADGEKGLVNKIRFAAVSAVSIMYLLKHQRDAFGLSLFSDEIEQHTQTRSTTMHYRLLLSFLEELVTEKRRNQQTEAASCLHLIAESIHKRSLVVIFSDMFESITSSDKSMERMDELFAALQHLKYNKHEVILFHTVDQRKEIEFQFDNRPYVFVDMETGERVKLRPGQVKDHYVTQVQEFKKELQLRCAQYRIDFVEADINKDFRQVLLPYLKKRGKLF